MLAPLVPGDPEGEPLPDEGLEVLHEAVVQLGGGAEGTLPGDLHLDAATRDAGDDPFHRQLTLEGLLELAAVVEAMPRAAPQQEGAALVVAAQHDRFDGVPDPDRHVALGVGQVRDVDRALGLGAEVHEGALGADGQDPAPDAVAHLGHGLGRSRVRTLELAQKGCEIFLVGHGRGSVPERSVRVNAGPLCWVRGSEGARERGGDEATGRRNDGTTERRNDGRRRVTEERRGVLLSGSPGVQRSFNDNVRRGSEGTAAAADGQDPAFGLCRRVGGLAMSGNEVGAIGQRLLDLRAQHREVHELIEKLLEGPYVDQVTLRRLKKRKLQLKDMISRMESDLIPDLDA